MYVGSGIGSLDDAYDTAVAFDKGVSRRWEWRRACFTDALQGHRKVSPLFVPRLLINLAAGHISMRYGFKVCASLDVWMVNSHTRGTESCCHNGVYYRCT